MSTTPRVSAPVAGKAVDFVSVMAHVPETIERFFDLYAAFWQRGVVADEIKEMTRIRNARITDCGY